MNILKLLKPDREEIIEHFIKGVVGNITKNWEYKFSYEEQTYILNEISERVFEAKKTKRNELISEAREIQNSITPPETDE